MTSAIHNSLQLQGIKCPVLFNDCIHSQTEDLHEFPIFSQLPLDISAAIWRCVLQCYRLIVIEVTEDNSNNNNNQADDPQNLPLSKSTHQEPLSSRKNSLGNTISERNYHLRITTCHRLHPLFQVCHESRQAALQFYRVHIPSDFSTHGNQRCIYLNPEFDFLHIKQQDAPHLLVDFVHDLKAYDPLGIGILNIGIGDNGSYELELPTGMI